MIVSRDTLNKNLKALEDENEKLKAELAELKKKDEKKPLFQKRGGEEVVEK